MPGDASNGYEPVLRLFEDGRRAFGRGGGAYSAYVGGRKVVDAWGGTAGPGRPWERDTTAVIMSATKGLTSLCVQILVEEGRIDLDALVTDYWPEFGAAGKATTTVRHLMLHTAGLLGFPKPYEVLGWDGRGWDDYDAIARAFAAAPPSWQPGSKHGYHATSFGWLVGEVVRRVTGQTVGTFFRDRIGDPLGLDTWIGTPTSEVARVAHIIPTDPQLLPRWMRGFYRSTLALTCDETSLTGQSFLAGHGTGAVDQIEALMNTHAFLTAEFPSGNGTSTARSLARVFAMVGNGGTLDGQRVLAPETIDAFAERRMGLPDELGKEMKPPLLLRKAAGAEEPRAMGYLGNAVGSAPTPMMGPNPASFGVAGLGGQVAFCDQQHGIAAAYIRNDLALIDVFSADLTAELYKCAAAEGAVPAAVLTTSGSRVQRAVGRAGAAYLRRVQRRSATG
jgi:CubicO group peptidase (beta-lactamase class C family)